MIKDKKRLALEKKDASSVRDVIKIVLESEHLTAPLNTKKVFTAWDNASGAGNYTVRRFFRDGKLYITVNSSVIRSQLSFQKQALLERINSLLSEDDMFFPEETGTRYVKELIIK